MGVERGKAERSGEQYVLSLIIVIVWIFGLTGPGVLIER